MNNISKGMIAGLAATTVLSIIMVMKGMMGLMPQLNVIAMLSAMMGTSSTIAWVIHFMIGMIVWGIGFAVLFNVLPGKSTVTKGITFGIAAWLMMMVVVMPMTGSGVFGLKIGMMAPAMTLMLHVIFGAVLGSVFGKIASSNTATATDSTSSA